MVILGIDPGDVESAYVLWDGKYICGKGKVKNEDLLGVITEVTDEYGYDLKVVIEMVASYGMPVGATIFETCVWVGRIIQKCEYLSIPWEKVYRIQIKNHICHSSRAKDSNIVQALIDEYADVKRHGKYGKGTLKDQGFFFGFSKDIWQAFAVAVYGYGVSK